MIVKVAIDLNLCQITEMLLLKYQSFVFMHYHSFVLIFEAKYWVTLKLLYLLNRSYKITENDSFNL